jgi:anti-anti-sigma factor
MSVIDRSTSIEVSEDQGAVIVHVRSDITVKNSTEICEAVQSAWEEKGRPHRLILDLTGVQHIDSSGIGALMEIQQRMTNTNTMLVLTGLEEAPRRLLERTGISRLFEIRGGANDMSVVLPASRRRQERLRSDRTEDLPRRKRHRALWALLWLCLIVGGLIGIGVSAYPTLQNYRAQLDQVPVLSGVLRSVDQRVQAVEQGWKDRFDKIEARLNGSLRASRRQTERLVAGSENRVRADMDQRTSELRSQLAALEEAQRATDARMADLQEQLQQSQASNGAKEGQQQ